MLFRTVPSANTLVRWVNENAFAFIVQARPCPTFGRPVHLRGGPHRLQPGTSPHALRIPPHDGHPAFRKHRGSASGPPWSVSGFRLRARLDFSIPASSSGQRGITPAFGYSAPHPSAGGTSTLPIKRAAQRTLRPDPSPWRLCPHFPLTVIAGISSTRFLRRAPRVSPVSTSSFTPCRR
jgi:hypothetical protein